MKGRLEDVRVLVEGHDVEKTGMSVDEMVSREGRVVVVAHSPLQMAVMYEQFEIVQYFVKTFTKVDLIGQTNWYGLSGLHYAARYSKKNVQTLQCPSLINYNGNIEEIINQRLSMDAHH